MFSAHKNSYLQSCSGDVNPRIINRAVAQARSNRILLQSPSDDGLDSFDYEPPHLRLASEQPFHPICCLDVTRRPLAFGVEGQVRKLIRDLHSKSKDVVLDTLSSCFDALQDPEKGYTALKLNIINRLADLIWKRSEVIRERTICVLNVLAGAADGKEMIMKNESLVLHMRTKLDDINPFVRMKAALLVRTVASFWVTADHLMDNDFMPTIIGCIIKQETECLPFLLDSLIYLMYGLDGKEAAYELDALSILLKLLSVDDEQTVAKSLQGIARLLQLPLCQKRVLDKDVDLLRTLDVLLRREDPAVYNAAAEAIMFATIKMRAKLEMERFMSMPKRLVQLAGSCHDETSQIFAIKALTNICEYPPLRLFVNKNFLTNIEVIPVKCADIMRYKDILLDIVSNVSNLGQVIYNVRFNLGTTGT